jgi:hypothetical protein
MRAMLMLIVPMTAAVALTVAAQQGMAQPRQAETETFGATSAHRPRAVRIKHHTSGHVGRPYILGGPQDICRVINGWRAFRNRHDPDGYFYNGRVPCHR